MPRTTPDEQVKAHLDNGFEVLKPSSSLLTLDDEIVHTGDELEVARLAAPPLLVHVKSVNSYAGTIFVSVPLLGERGFLDISGTVRPGALIRRSR